jgi:RHS repeat-associated protein
VGTFSASGLLRLSDRRPKFLYTSSYTHAQNIRNTDYSPDKALKSNARVNPSTLAMEISIPLVGYPGRGGNSVPVTLDYSSKVWDFDNIGQFPNNFNVTVNDIRPLYARRSAAGWSSSLATVRIDYKWDVYEGNFQGGANYEGQIYAPAPWETPPDNNLYIVKRLHVTMPGGSTHEFRVNDVPVFCGTISSKCDGAPDLTGTFLSTDGSRMRLESGTSSSVLYLPNGSRYEFGAKTGNINLAHTFYDVHGNRMSYNSTTQTWTDTLGRLIEDPLPTNWDGIQNQVVQNDTVSFPGLFADSYNVVLGWDLLQNVLNNPTDPLRYIGWKNCDGEGATLVSPYLFSDGGEHQTRICNLGSPFNPVVLKNVTFPNGQSYEFKYNVFGEIEKITYPTGAYERFVYGAITPIQAGNYAYDQANRGVINRYVSATGVPGDEIPWTYTAGRASPLDPYIVTTTAPDGSITKQYLHDESPSLNAKAYGFTKSISGRSYDERVYDSSTSHHLRSRKLTEFEFTGPIGSGAWPLATRDMRPRREVSIIFDPNNSNALATMTETLYDTADPVGSTDPAYFSSLNAKQQKAYHYIAKNASVAENADLATAMSWFNGATPASLTHTTYLYDANYRNRNINGLVSQTQVLDPANPSIVKAKSQITYDGAALLNEATSTRWDNPNSIYRGLVTSTKSWFDIGANQFIETTAQYDLMGNLRYSWDGRNNLTQTVYSSTYDYAYPTTVITPVPDPTGTYGSASSFTTSTAYDYNTGLPTSTTDANNQTTSMAYVDPLYRPTLVTAPNGHQTITEYGSGTSETTRWVKVRSQIDNVPRFKESVSWYDGLGRAVKSQSIDPQGDVFALTCYDEMGRVSKSSNPFRNVSNPTCSTALEWTSNTFDSAGRPWKVTTPDGAVVETLYELSPSGEIGTAVTVKDQAQKQRRSITNALGQLKRVDEPTSSGLGTIASPHQPTSYDYDTLNNLKTVNQGAQTRDFVYDALSRLTSAANPESGTTSYQYDNGGNLIVKTDERNVSTHYAYDNLNRVFRRWYNGSDSVSAITNNSPPLPAGVAGTAEARYTYDTGTNGLGRLAIAETGFVTWGNNWSQLTANEYLDRDVMGRAQLYRQMIGTIWSSNYYDVNYAYNLDGSVSQITYPSAHGVIYGYDSAGRTNSVTGTVGDGSLRTYADSFEYTPWGTLGKERFGTTTPLYHTQQFNARGQVWDMRLGTSPFADDRGSIVNFYSAGYSPGGSGPDNNGNVLRQKIAVPGSNFYEQTYAYDPLNRLASIIERLNGVSDSFTQVFDYDRYGNRTINADLTINAPKPQFDMANLSAQNRLYSPNETFADNCPSPSSTTRLMCYDKAGNLIRDKHVTNAAWITYDADGKISQYDVDDAQSSPVYYLYDADGKRRRKTLPNGKPQAYIYGLGGELLAEGREDLLTKEYVYRNGDLLASATVRLIGSDVRWLVKDHLGTPRIVADKTGNLSAIKRHDYLPFGEEIGSTVGGRDTSQGYGNPQSDGVRQQFTGYERDTESGLDFAQARYFGSSLGRFTAVDPLASSATPGSPQSWNRYAYVGNNPLVRIDPTGMIDLYYNRKGELLGETGKGNKIWFATETRRDDNSTWIDKNSRVETTMAEVEKAKISAVPLRPGTGPDNAQLLVNELGARASGSMQMIGVLAGASVIGGLSVGGGAVAAGGTVLASEVLAGALVANSFLNDSPESDASVIITGSTTTIGPGPFAGESIPARDSGRQFTVEERTLINNIGKETGCHTCGTKDPGTKSGNFILDHQLPSAINPAGVPQRLFPQCLQCSLRQGGQIRWYR